MIVANITALLATALLFGGMTLFSFAFAAFLFNSLPADQAGRLLRRAFPHFYLFVIGVALLPAILLARLERPLDSLLLLTVLFTAIPARQLLMPAINAATDAGNHQRFRYLHGVSVLVTLVHIGICAFVLVRFI